VLSGEVPLTPPEEAPEEPAPAVADLIGRPRLGVSIANVNSSSRAARLKQIPDGVFITAVDAGSPAEKAGLLGYINRWFLRSAVLTENEAIFAALKTGYNAGTPNAVAGWKALKKSINVDLDPSCKLQGIIVTNQSGFACLDEEEDANGRPILQVNPANPTEKLFQGLPVHVFPDAQLPNIDGTHFPVFYGDTKAGATFVEHQALEFATSEHFGFNKNMNYMRVIEGFDVMSTDTTAYIYGSFAASAKG
jgi:HK97 family phage major capsid protein